MSARFGRARPGERDATIGRLWHSVRTMRRFLTGLAIAAAVGSGTAYGAPAGPPARPAVGPAADSALAAHPLKYAPGALDNPLKGFAPFYAPGRKYDGKFPHSVEWSYFALSDLMQDFDRFSWEPIEKVLNDVSARGRQLSLRVYLEYPTLKSGVPEFLIKSGVALRKTERWNTESPDYDDPRTVRALSNFIKAFGARYDGDPRVAFVHMGLVGLWGEWHLWPSTNLFPKDKTVSDYIDAYDAAFNRTQIEIRYFGLAGGYAIKKNIGFHDDSIFFRESGKGVTLPASEGGQDWAFLQDALKFGGENRWIEQSIGGEARPEIQRLLAAGPGKLVDDPLACVEFTHVSWLMNQAGIGSYKTSDPGITGLVRRMGYELYVSEARFNDIGAKEALRVGVTIENRGVAPFYYPWRPVVAVVDEKNQIRGSWYASWDLRDVQPLEVRAFKEWKIADGAKYVPFGRPRHFAFERKEHGLGPGRYRLLLRVVHPLEQPLAERRGRGESVQAPLPLRFANDTQRENGWLVLGDFNVNSK